MVLPFVPTHYINYVIDQVSQVLQEFLCLFSNRVYPPNVLIFLNYFCHNLLIFQSLRVPQQHSTTGVIIILHVRGSYCSIHLQLKIENETIRCTNITKQNIKLRVGGWWEYRRFHKRLIINITPLPQIKDYNLCPVHC
jgi:hypothetical protein